MFIQNDCKIKEECGVFGFYDMDGYDSAQMTYYGLFSLQHRGQESCGIAACSGSEIRSYKNMGLVNDVFKPDVLSLLSGSMAIGHVRYSTTGESRRENAQPLVTKYSGGMLAIAHNGNLTNGVALRNEFEDKGMLFHTTIDSECIAYVIAQESRTAASLEDAVSAAMPRLKGAYSLVIMTPEKMLAVRDELGMRPLCIGKLGNSFIFASESCAIDAVGGEFVRDVLPGEIVTVDKNGLTSNLSHSCKKGRICIFEYIYFARSDSVIEGLSVYEARKMAGRLLARQNKLGADLVIGVPDSGLDAAIGFAEESGIPYGIGLLKNRYIGRTFIQPDQKMRERSVRLKLNPLKSAVEGKRIVMIDDSIVRGTTCRRIVNMLKEAGAKEVHMLSSAPPFLYPCYFGTDIPSQDLLVSWKRTTEEVRQIINADSLGFLDPASLGEMIKGAHTGYCDACFTGNYPMETPYRGC